MEYNYDFEFKLRKYRCFVQNGRQRVMNDKSFSSPVLISLGAMGLRLVSSAWEALECLKNQWPQQDGVEYRRATRMCRDALEGWMPPAKARQAFVIAAQRAGVLIGKPTLK
jgi:ribosomal 50S subunit-associated protein YjgA (DUF615 family)